MLKLEAARTNISSRECVRSLAVLSIPLCKAASSCTNSRVNTEILPQRLALLNLVSTNNRHKHKETELWQPFTLRPGLKVAPKAHASMITWSRPRAITCLALLTRREPQSIGRKQTVTLLTLLASGT